MADKQQLPHNPPLPKLYARAAKIVKALLGDQPTVSLMNWIGYFHNVDQTILRANSITYPSKNCLIPQKDIIVPRAGKTLLGASFTANKNWPIVGHKERFATMGGKVVEIRVTKSDDPGLGDIIEVLYPNPLTGVLQWYTITEGMVNGSQNPFLPGLHEYYFDDWLDTNLDPSLSLNVSRLIWTNGNNQIYSWVGAIAEVVNVTQTAVGTFLSVDNQKLFLSSQSGTFQVGEVVTCSSGTGASFYISAISGGFITMILVNLGSGSNPFPIGGTITGGISGATGIIGQAYTKPILKTWGQLGFYDPSSNFSYIIINGTRYQFFAPVSPLPVECVAANAYAFPDIQFAPTTPTVHVGDVVFSHPRADGYTIPPYFTPNSSTGLDTEFNFINTQIPNQPFDVCKNYKGFMFYGNWTTRVVLQANQFGKDAVIEVTFVNAVLDNFMIPSTSQYLYSEAVSSGVPYVTHLYVIQIVSVATPNQYLVLKDGIVSHGGNIPVGGIINIDPEFPSLTGIFDTQTGHGLNDTWTVTITPKVSFAWTDFFYSLNTRNPGEGYRYLLTSNFWAMEVQEGDLYVNTQFGDWSYITITDSVNSTDQSASEILSITPLKQASVSKVIYPYMLCHMDNDLVFVTTDKTIDMIGRRAFLELPQIGYLSQPVELDFQAASFTNGSMKYWQKRLHITSPKELTMMVYDNKTGNKYWQPPQDYAENGILSIIDDTTLISHSNLRNQSFILFDGQDGDDGIEYTVVAVTPANAYGARWGTKMTSKSFLEGYMTGKPPLMSTVYKEINGEGGIFPHKVQPIFVPIITRAPIGSGSLASHQLGSDKPTNAMRYWREIWPQQDPLLQYYFLALGISCTCKDHSYSVLSMGVNYVAGNLGNNPYIPQKVISEQ